MSAASVRDGLVRARRWFLAGDPTAEAILELERPGRAGPPPRRAVWLAALFSLGIALGDSVIGASSIAIFALAATLSVVGFAVRGRALPVFLGAAVVLLGAAHVRSVMHERSADDLAFALTEQPAIIRVEGRVEGPIEYRDELPGAMARYAFGSAGTRFRLNCDTLVGLDGERRHVSGTLLASVSGDALGALRLGQRVRLIGLARTIAPPMNPGAFDAPRWAMANGISGRISLDSAELITTLDGAPPPILSRVSSWLDARARAWIGDESSSPERALVAAMLLGDRGDALEETERTFRRVGLAHVLAISGLHVGVMVFLAILALRLTGDRPRLHALLLVVALGAYLLLVPARTPIVRTAILSLALIASELAGKRYDRLTLLAWVMVAVLIWKPAELFSAGFQLSFAVVASLVLLHAPVRARLFGYRSPINEGPSASLPVRWSQDLVVASVVSWAVSAPIVALHFGAVPLVGIASSVVVLPVVLLLISMGYVALFVGLFSTAGAMAIMALMSPVASVALWSASLFEALPMAELIVPTPAMWWAAVALGTAVWWLVRGTWRAPMAYGVSALLSIVAIIAWTGTGVARGTALRIDMLSVGDGTCILLRAREDALLYDAGSRYPGLGLRTVPDALRALGARTVRRAIVSHPNTDHLNALPDAAQTVGLREVIVGRAMHEAATADPDGAPAFFLDSMADQGVAVRTTHAGESVRLGNLSFEVLSPASGTVYEGANDNSIVLFVSVPTCSGTVRVLLTGDIERGAIGDLLDDRPALRADIMEIPHHGSARPAAMAFVESLDPAVALQSTGPSRLDGERWDDVRAGRDWRVTARDGAVTVVIRDNGAVIVRSFRE